MSETLHPLATGHLPPFITPPGANDVLMNVMIVVLLAIILIVGNLYLRLHSLPERMAHRTHKMQFEIVAILGLLALFTHNNFYWVAGLLLALIRIPDFWTPLGIIAESQKKIASHLTPAPEPESEPYAATAETQEKVASRLKAAAEPKSKLYVATPENKS